jgi:hypothetical protein
MELRLDVTCESANRETTCDACGDALLPSDRVYTVRATVPGVEVQNMELCTDCKVRLHRAVTFDPHVWDALTDVAV